MSNQQPWQKEYSKKIRGLEFKELLAEALQMAFLAGFHVTDVKEGIEHAWKADISKKALVRQLKDKGVL